jgi:hypothetical protein
MGCANHKTILLPVILIVPEQYTTSWLLAENIVKIENLTVRAPVKSHLNELLRVKLSAIFINHPTSSDKGKETLAI